MIWPFKQKPKEEPKPLDFEDALQFRLDGKFYMYRPAKDITAYEVALLWPLCYAHLIQTDLVGYLDKHNLLRHFVIKE